MLLFFPVLRDSKKRVCNVTRTTDLLAQCSLWQPTSHPPEIVYSKLFPSYTLCYFSFFPRMLSFGFFILFTFLFFGTVFLLNFLKHNFFNIRELFSNSMNFFLKIDEAFSIFWTLLKIWWTFFRIYVFFFEIIYIEYILMFYCTKRLTSSVFL